MDENAPSNNQGQSLKSHKNGDASMGLQNITNQLPNLSVSTSPLGPFFKREPKSVHNSESGSWLDSKPRTSIASTEAGKPVATDIMSKYALAHAPSGPRKVHQGTEEVRQRILHVSNDDIKGTSEIKVTLLAAGFVIGPSGHSIRAICEQSGANIQSCTRTGTGDTIAKGVPYRAFMVVGSAEQREIARHIISQAVSLYQNLFAGKLGKSVSRHQFVCGVKFVWSPPPKSAVPHATPLQDSHNIHHGQRRPRHAPTRRYAEGTYISPDGGVFPASYLFKNAEVNSMLWPCSPLPVQDRVDMNCYGAEQFDGPGSFDPDLYNQQMYFNQADPAVIAVAAQMATAFWNQQPSTIPQHEVYVPPHPAYNSVQRSSWRRHETSLGMPTDETVNTSSRPTREGMLPPHIN